MGISKICFRVYLQCRFFKNRITTDRRLKNFMNLSE